jgi:hypothetical protein
MRSSRISALLVVVVAACSVGLGCHHKKSVNDSCLYNTDCADDICHDGVCGARHPLTNGSSCSGNGECLSFSCQAGLCAVGIAPMGSSCLYPEECGSGDCTAGVCGQADGGVPPSDAGPQSDAGSDAPVTCVGNCVPSGVICDCNTTCGGHTYAISCDSPAAQCTCTIDGTSQGTISGDYGQCAPLDSFMVQAWAACGFPPLS